MMRQKEYAEQVKTLADNCVSFGKIDVDLYAKSDVQRGLRDKNGNGVLAGLTKVSKIESFQVVDGQKQPCDGRLFYRGYSIQDLIKGVVKDKRFGFEEVAYLLLFGKLPNEEELEEFKALLAFSRKLPTNFVRDVIMKAPSKDIMNSLSKSILTLAS